ncbi:BrnA antitoxin family protein [Asticcacaulis sp. BYS171W]|uniref:BrnA antitoxin family protein n=1 Tax=Asticcacaulis aquaticus TaxID=2984212 RepID=A0ABT5HY45_9CAUL|nr:BrnA antitoxin family protein [Asticcacaulis aquaticus]MDC7685001.1 BrnA antitoxin family protein [Asticcacaulis aquaticus]
MKSKIVRYQFDPTNPPPLTDKQKAEINALAARPDNEIDVSDIPPLTDDFWKNAVRNPFRRPVKQQATVRLDADVMAWLKSSGKGYQTRLNAILRKAMLADLKRRA